MCIRDRNEPQTEVSWATPWGKATMKKVADLNETESYDTTKSFYEDYDLSLIHISAICG